MYSLKQEKKITDVINQHWGSHASKMSNSRLSR